MSACVKQAKMETTTSGNGAGGNNGNKKNIVEIYTDWANHYLDKTKVGFIGNVSNLFYSL